MANEIVLISFNRLQTGGASARLMFLYPVTPVIETFNGVTVVPTPVNTLPAEVAALNLLTQGELNAISSGDATFLVAEGFITDAELADLPSLAEKIRNIYAARNPVEELRERFSRTGQRINA